MTRLYIKTKSEWRKWLTKNHNKVEEVWLIFYKKETGKPSIDYEAAVEEALCFGWIDSLVKKIDDQRYRNAHHIQRYLNDQIAFQAEHDHDGEEQGDQGQGADAGHKFTFVPLLALGTNQDQAGQETGDHRYSQVNEDTLADLSDGDVHHTALQT